MKTLKFFALVLSLVLFVSAGLQASPLQTPPQAAASSLTAIDSVIGQQLQSLTNGEGLDIEPQETFGTKALGFAVALGDALAKQSGVFLSSFMALPQMGAWFTQQATTPSLVVAWQNTGALLVFVLAVAVGSAAFAHIVLMPLRRTLVHRTARSWPVRLGMALGWLGLALVPIIVFVGVSLAVMDQNEPPKLARFVTMNVIYALALHWLVMVLSRFFLAPKAPNLRLVDLADSAALYLRNWIGRLGFVMIYGYFCVDVMRTVRLPASAVSALSNILGLVIVVMAIIVILQRRTAIAQLIRGTLTASARHDMTLWQSLRLWLARSWHQLAIAYLVIGYAVTIFSVGNGFALMLRGTILTLAILVAMRLALHSIARVGHGATSHFYRPVLRLLLRLVVWLVATLAMLAAWGVDVWGLMATPWGQRVTGSLLSISVTILCATLAYETLNAAIERRLKKRTVGGVEIPVSARLLTLLPLARNTALIILTATVILVILSECGVNTAPLLAGAGVIGVAVGFGSQSLVKDFITGLFILMEDAIAIGDVVAIGTYTGVVESMTIRTIRLRAFNGDLHILPFGEVAKMTNQTKGFAFAVMDINVAYGTDLTKAMEVFKEIGADMQANPPYKDMILTPIEVLGVQDLADSAIILRSKIKTLPGKQWEVRRAFLARVTERFNAEGIEIPFPTVRQLV